MCVRQADTSGGRLQHMREAAVTNHLASPNVYIWRHFAILTIFGGRTHIRDHLFLVREGWPKSVFRKFKVVTFDRVFEIGSMAGLKNKNQ